jgi:diguanylate cyclase
LKQWVKKLADQLEWNNGNDGEPSSTHSTIEMSEERATLLYLVDAYSKHLIEIDSQPVRKVRQSFDEFVKQLVNPEQQSDQHLEKHLFQLRQFFAGYRLQESTYVQRTFEDFKKIIWDFAEQLNEDIHFEQANDLAAQQSLEQLREAVEANSIEGLRSRSREFIDLYAKYQSQKDDRRNKRITSMKKNLNLVKKQLMEANQNMRLDHLTSAFNRKSFDEQMKKHQQLASISQVPVSVIILDIDFFKKINDAYGHDIGDFVLKECVVMLKEVFHREDDFVARIGGEEFAVILPSFTHEHAVVRAEEAMAKIRKEVFVHDKLEITFTVSMGIAQLLQNETTDEWIKRADTALYESKHSGRNRYTVAPHAKSLKSVA